MTRAVADALQDRSLKILHSFPDEQEGWVDESGVPVALTDARVAQEVTEVAGGRWRIAIVHDPVLAEHHALVQSAGSFALAALENEHLSGELRSRSRRWRNPGPAPAPLSTASAASSNVTSTTARSSAWLRFGSSWRWQATS